MHVAQRFLPITSEPTTPSIRTDPRVRSAQAVELDLSSTVVGPLSVDFGSGRHTNQLRTNRRAASALTHNIMGGSSTDEIIPASASQFSTLQNLIKPFIGAGILALPSAFKNGGVLASAILMAILAVGVNYCIRCLLTSVDYVYARENGLQYDVQSGKFSSQAYRRKKRAAKAAARAASLAESESLNDLYAAGGGSFTEGEEEEVPGYGEGDEIVESNTGLSDAPILRASPKAASAASSSAPASDLPMNPRNAAPIYSFREIGSFAYGTYGCLSVDINLVASQIGFCIAYMSFISQNMIEVVDTLTRVEWVCVLMAAWMLLVQLRDIRTIAFTSGFGNAVYLASLTIIFYDGFSKHCCVTAHDAAWIRPSGLALVFGTGCFALEGIGLVLPVKRAMKQQKKFSSVLNIAITFVTILYVVFGVCGYLFYGDSVHSVITKNLSGGGVSDAVRISLSVSLFFTYAIQLFPVSEILDGLWDSHVFKRETNTQIDEVGINTPTSDGVYQPLKPDNALPGSYGVSNGTNGHSSNGHTVASSSSSSVVKSSSSSAHLDHLMNVEESMLGDVSTTRAGHTIPPILAMKRPLNPKREFALIATRCGLVLFTGGVSIIFPNFGLIVSLVGSFSNSAIAFILPQIFYLKLVIKPEARRTGSEHSSSWWIRYKSFLVPYSIIVAGVAASVIGVYTTIKDMVDGDDN